jgi:lipopolysaccharide export system protein LptA
VNADSLSARTDNGRRIQDLFGNVFVRQDTTRLRSDYARRFLEEDRFLFTDDVVIYERGDTLRADTVRYNKATKVGRARGNVRVTDGEVVVRAPRATYYTESKRSVFPDSVTLVDSARVLRARQGTYWSEDKRAEFRGRVRLTDPETYLEADSLAYFRDTERSIATGDVFIRRVGDEGADEEDASADTTSRTYLFGAWADNQEQARYSRVEGRAVLMRVRYDSTGAPEDTLAVRAHRLDAYRSDTHRRLIAIDSVRVWQADLAAVADSMVYDRVLAPGPPDTSAAPVAVSPEARGKQTERASRSPSSFPRADTLAGRARPGRAEGDTLATSEPGGDRPPPDTTREALPSDTTDADTTDADTMDVDTTEFARADRTAAGPDTSQGTAGGLPPPTSDWRRPAVDSADAVPLEETRLFGTPMTWFQQAQVWGDSIRVRARERSLDTVFVRGAAFAAQRDTALDRIHQLKGRTLTAYFRADTLQRILARPNARAIRFLADEGGALSGGLQTSADRIVLRFRAGRVHRVSVLGGVESTLYQKPDLIPDPFRLEGFQWTPDQKPTRRRLLDEERVRRRLTLDLRRPPVAREDRTATDPEGERPVPEGAGARPSSPPRSPPDSLLDRRERLRPSRPDSLQDRVRRPPPDTTDATDPIP